VSPRSPADIVGVSFVAEGSGSCPDN
jgi:hypothetical protein